MAIIDPTYYIRPLNQSKNSSHSSQDGDVDAISILPGQPIKAGLVGGTFQQYNLPLYTIDYFSIQNRAPIELIVPNASTGTMLLFNTGGLLILDSGFGKSILVPRYCYWMGELKAERLILCVPKKCRAEFLLVRQTPTQMKQWLAGKVAINLLPGEILSSPRMLMKAKVVVQPFEKRQVLALTMAALGSDNIEYLKLIYWLNWLMVACWQRSYQSEFVRMADANLPGEVIRIYRAVEGLVMTMEQPFSLQLFAKKTGMNPNMMQEKFKAIFGCSVYRFLLQIRMEKATYLLQETELPIDQVAFAVGFPNPAHFSTAFRKFNGSTPSGLRKLNVKGIR